MGINAREFCDHGYTKIKICPSCLKERDDQIKSLQSQLSRMEEAIKKAKDGLSCEININNYNDDDVRELLDVSNYAYDILKEALSSRAGGEGKNG